MSERPDIWHDDEGVWVEAGTGPLGPFKSEDEAERAYTKAMVEEVSRALAELDDDTAQQMAADLNQALTALEPAPIEPPGDHVFTVTVGECTNDQAHKVMTERLGHDEDYGFHYLVNWAEATPELPPASSSPQRATDVALSVNSIRTARFSRRGDDTITGVAYCGLTEIEYDVRLSGDVWYVNDDRGRTYEHTILERALLRAIEANRRNPGGTT